MSELEQYTEIIMNVLSALKDECHNFEYCNTKCPFYNNNEGTCYLKAYPCDYDLLKIKNAVSQIITNEMNKI